MTSFRDSSNRAVPSSLYKYPNLHGLVPCYICNALGAFLFKICVDKAKATQINSNSAFQ